MPDVLNPQVLDQGTATNAKMLMDMSQVTMGQTIQDIARQQSRQNDLAASVLANAMNGAQQVHQLAAQGAQQIAQAAGNLTLALSARTAHAILNSAEQAAAFDKTLAANLEGKMANLEAALSSGQQMAKIANTTPPETGVAQLLANLAASQAAIIELLKNKTG